MKAFIDTNILIDFICKREPFFIPAKAVFTACFLGKIKIVLSGLSIVNLLYICRKYDQATLKLSLIRLSQYIENADLPSATVLNGLRSEWADYEDFLQYETALANQCDCLLTRNTADFATSSIPVYNAVEFIALIDNKITDSNF